MLPRMTALQNLYRDHVAALTDHAHALLDATGYDKLAIHGGRLVLKSSFDDQDWPFRPVPAVEHWAKVDWPDTTVLVTKGDKPRLAVVRSDSFWERPEEPDWDLIRTGIEVVEASSFDEVAEMVRGGRIAFVGHDAAIATALGADANPTPVVEMLHERRTIKTAYEIECMAEASRIAARGHVAARDAFLAGEKSELAIHLAYLAATGLDDPQCPYKNIVALNDAAAILHHIHYRTVDTSRSLLIDAGAVHRGYCSDITRTYAAKIPGAEPFAELIERMDHLQRAVVDAVAVGMQYEALHDRAHALMGALLVETGLYRGSAESAVELGVTRKLFPHGLGHSLGVQVHDVGMRLSQPREDNPFLRNTSKIAEGQVFTIEPGLYFIDTLLGQLKDGDGGNDVDWDRVEALKPFGGIRIEDNVLVTADGHRNLTREAFASL
jgi:Xaa-Pro dipeptidase